MGSAVFDGTNLDGVGAGPPTVARLSFVGARFPVCISENRVVHRAAVVLRLARRHPGVGPVEFISTVSFWWLGLCPWFSGADAAARTGAGDVAVAAAFILLTGLALAATASIRVSFWASRRDRCSSTAIWRAAVLNLITLPTAGYLLLHRRLRKVRPPSAPRWPWRSSCWFTA